METPLPASPSSHHISLFQIGREHTTRLRQCPPSALTGFACSRAACTRAALTQLILDGLYPRCSAGLTSMRSSAPLRDAGPDCGRRWRAVIPVSGEARWKAFASARSIRRPTRWRRGDMMTSGGSIVSVELAKSTGLRHPRIPADDEWKREPGDGAGRSGSRKVGSRADRTWASGATGNLHWVGRDVDAPVERPWGGGPSRTVRWCRDHRGGVGAVATDLFIERAYARCRCGPDGRRDCGGAVGSVGATAPLVPGRSSVDLLRGGRAPASGRGWGDLGVLSPGDAAYPLVGDLRQPGSAWFRYRCNGCHIPCATDPGGPTAVSQYRVARVGPLGCRRTACWLRHPEAGRPVPSSHRGRGRLGSHHARPHGR